MEEIPEELSNIVLISKSAEIAYTLRDVAGKQIGRVQYFLHKEYKELMDCGESLLLEGKISKLSYPCRNGFDKQLSQKLSNALFRKCLLGK